MFESTLITLFFAASAIVCGVYVLYCLPRRRLAMLTRYVYMAEEPVSYWLFIGLCFAYGAGCLDEALAFLR